MKSQQTNLDWFEVYYSYLEGCRSFNQYESPEPGWEWNHTLPRCLFGDTEPGMWLTNEQHAIASAYQTLAFQTSCVFGGHLKLLPSWLKALVQPYWLKRQGERGKLAAGRGAETCKRLKKGAMFRTREKMIEDGRKGALAQSFEHRSKCGKKGSATTNSQRWVDPDHPELGIRTSGTLVKMQKARGYPSSPSNRKKLP